MEKEKKKNFLKNSLNPFYKGVCKMKALRITMVLLALLVLPLFATQTLAADFFVPLYDVPNGLVGANTDNKPVIGFILEHLSGETLDKVTVRSFIQRVYATERLKLWREDGTTAGFQAGEDELWKTHVTSGIEFDINEEITFLGINKVLPTDDEVFYITLDIYTDKVNANPGYYHETGLEVTLDEGYIVLKNGDANSNDVRNPGWIGPPDPFFNPYTLIFDCFGPYFDLHFCIEGNTCSLYAYYEIEPYTRVEMVDQEDTIRICATDVEGDIEGDIHVIGKVHLLGYVSAKHMFGVDPILLKSTDEEEGGECDDQCDPDYNTTFVIPDQRNTGGFNGVDADTGHWYVCAWAEDSVGNRDTICIGHEDLAYKIDTKKPIIDEVTWELVHDWNGDGKIGLGDCIMIIGKGFSNPIEPLKECVQMRVDTSWMAGNSSSYPDGEWAVLSDTLQENNRIFRRVFCLTNPLPIDSSGGCPVNFLVEAWDNACNYDTSRGEICADMDLDPPYVEVLYEWHTDYDTMWACMGLGDRVLIEATVGGVDIVSVTTMMDSAGIDELMRHALPLPNRGGGVYDTIWTITEPPILYGKDRDNTQPPARDSIYRAWVVACDDFGNCDTAYGDLNKTLDTRRPRPIGYSQFCPDSVPCALTAQSLAGGIIALMWDTACDENDAYAFYVWASYEGAAFDSIGYTDVTEQPLGSKYWSWHSEPLAEGYWTFKIKTEDNCSNVGDFSCVVGAYADATPPHVCIAVPDSGLTFGSWFPLKAVADSASHDADSACLWYRLRPDIENPTQDPGGWTKCPEPCGMYRPGDGYVFTDSVHCLEGVDYIGWVEMIVTACDEVGNCQDTSMAYDDACLVDDDVFRPGRFFFYWDTLAPALHLVSVNGFPSPQSDCGFDVDPTIMNEVVIDVDGATAADSFEVEVRGPCSGFECRLIHEDNVTMPYTFEISVDGWDEGTQNLYINVKDYNNDTDADLQVQLCVPPTAPENCIYISSPHEWMRIPCTGTSGYNCVQITARMYEYAYCEGDSFTEVRFQWSPNGIDSWETIADVIGSGPSWSTCWDNTNEVEHGDTIYLRVIAHDEFYMADTSYMVKVFVDCEQPNVKLRIEDLYYTCSNEIPKVSCDPLTLKAVLEDTLIDIDRIRFFFKRHSVPDIHEYWIPIDGWAEPAWSDNIWMYFWEEPCCNGDKRDDCMEPGDYYDIRIAARDIAGHYMYDYDNDGFFDDSTFNQAVYDTAGFTVFVDNEAPQPAISRVADTDTLGNLQFEFVNPDDILGGSDKVYTKARDSVTVEISVLPSEDTCEVMKVEYFGCNIFDTCVHLGTSTDPYHYPVTFEPVAQGLMPYQKIENSWWRGKLVAVLYDSLGNSKSTFVDWYILDVTPSQAMIVNPENDSYVWGSVLLESRALNAYEINKVCYEYRAEGESDWYPVNEGYPNACAYHECGEDIGDYKFPIVWNTLNTIPDGAYYLRAVATDCSNNEDDDPPTIKVTVANELPTAVIEDPRICERECPDDTVDTLGYIAGTVTLYATTSSDIPVTKVEFWYKNIFTFPSDWILIGTDDFVSGGKYSVEWNTSSMTDGRYHVKARVYNAAGRYGDSDPITITTDNSAPFTQVVSIMGDPNPSGMDITKGDVIDIEIWAMDSTSDDGWTRCYNSGVVSIEVCIENCASGEEITKCFEVDPAYDGFHTIQWNTSGLEFEGCQGCYYIYVKATDCLGNTKTSSYVTVYVSDIKAPITTIAGFDGNYIYGYSSEKVSTLQFQYADSGSTNWIPIGWSEYVGPYCNYLYKTSWDYSGLADGIYQIRVISHDTCSNQDDSLAPVAYFTMYYGSLTPYYDPEVLFPMSFLKNWCTGDMQGIVQQTVTSRTPVMIARYGTSYECVHMQAELQHSTEYAGSFDASAIANGGSAKFFSSVTLPTAEMIEVYTGEEPAYVTYLLEGSFDIAHVKFSLGTHGTYQEGCVELTIPDGAVGDYYHQGDRYVWVAPTLMEWAPVTQPDILPIGDNNGYATHVSFTDCEYCCSWYVDASPFGGEGAQAAGAGINNGDDCCFNEGKHAIIKMCYDSEVEVAKEHLAVAWWDCDAGEYKFDPIFYPSTVEGFDTENHTVEFATTCLKGPFVVVRVLERQCEGSIVVNMLEIEPYCNGYTNTMPTFKSLITDNVQGTGAINQGSIQWKVDLFNPGEFIRIYTGAPSDICDRWTPGFGSFFAAGYDEVSGIFRAGWNDPDFFNTNTDFDCEGCIYDYKESDYGYYCEPMYPLAAGDHIATVTAMNSNIQTCTDTLQFKVDATKPKMWFADSVGAYVGKNPHFCIHFTDTESGVDKSSIWIDIYGDETSSPDPNNHQHIVTRTPDQLANMWVDDTTLCVDDLNFEYQYGYIHIFVYGGPDCLCYECNNPQYYYYQCGISDCVGNHINVFWRYFTVDADGPSISFIGDDYCDPVLQFQITDELSGLLSVYLKEDGSLATIEQDVHNPDFWWYTPTEGTQRVDIEAKDNLGNVNVFSFDLPSDCEGPAVEFADGYVTKNPTITFWVTDPAGVDWSTVNVYINGCNEECYYYAPDLTPYVDTETGKVTINGCHLDCSDGNEVMVYVFSGTSYTGNGPKDMNGNYGNARWCSFVVDAYGPSITWVNSSDPCDRPVKLDITDAKSGVAEVKVYEDGVEFPEALVYNSASGLWEYTPPPTGIYELDVVATDVVGNQTTYSFEVKDDCQGPAVSFASGYVTKNPTVKFWVSDPSGVDWATVNARVYGCGEECYYQAPELLSHVNTETGEVTLDGCNLDCSDGDEVEVWVYSGTSYTGQGPADEAGNYLPKYAKCSYVVDAAKPYLVSPIVTSNRPIEIKVADDRSGIDWLTLKFYEDSVLICDGLECTDDAVTIDTDQGVITYTPDAGRMYVQIHLWDYAGNMKVITFWTEAEVLAFDNPHNYQNPFDPRDGNTTIDVGLTQSATVTMKIYDFAGEFVRELVHEVSMSPGSDTRTWNGTTDDGTEVANGTYLCYIHARASDGNTRTAVIKITVLKQDK